MKWLTRERVVPIISASVSWLTLAMIGSGLPSLPKLANKRRVTPNWHARARPNNGNCIRLKGNERVGSRVAELQAEGAERAEVTLDSLIAEASEIKNKAMARGNYSAAVSALVIKAKLSGHWLDRAENKTNNVIYHISDKPLSLEEWEEKWCK